MNEKTRRQIITLSSYASSDLFACGAVHRRSHYHRHHRGRRRRRLRHQRAVSPHPCQSESDSDIDFADDDHVELPGGGKDEPTSFRDRMNRVRGAAADKPDLMGIMGDMEDETGEESEEESAEEESDDDGPDVRTPSAHHRQQRSRDPPPCRLQSLPPSNPPLPPVVRRLRRG